MEGQRHYSSIGIHDVFLSSIDLRQLPQSYDDSANSSFDSPEILGSIKSVPEDFIVRERASDKLKLPEEWRVADLRESVAPIAEPSVKKNEPVEGQKSGLELEQKLDPLEVVQRVLNAHHAEKSKEIMERLQSLQGTGLAELRRHASKNQTMEPPQEEHQFVLIPPIPSDTSCLCEVAEHGGDRGSLHRCLKLALPLLTTETIKQQDGAASVKATIDSSYFPLAPNICDPEVNLPQFYKFHKRGCCCCPHIKQQQQNRKRSHDRSTKYDSNDPSQFLLPLRPGLSKDDRRKIHHLISSKTRDFETGILPEYETTTSDGAIFKTTALTLRWSKSAQRKTQGRKTTNKTASLLFVMKKRQQEHLSALNMLTRVLRCRQADIGIAGIKDMHAITYQFCTIRGGVNQERLLRANGMLKSKGMEIGSVRPVDHILRQGELEGNRFVIIVRDVKRVRVSVNNKVMEETFVDCDRGHILARADAVRTHGFVNYYGEQRVGIAGTPEVVGVRSFDIGRSMLQRKFDKTVDLLMSGRLICRGIDEQEGAQVRKARQVWKDSGGNVEETVKSLPKGDSMARERAVLHGLKRYKNPLDALKCLNFGVRTFWIHAYQSYIWNKMASERLELYGRKVVAGDLVKADGDEVVSIATEDTASNYTLEQVVLPLPGYNMQYPDNEIGKRYMELLAEEDVKFEKNAPLEATAKGSYRRLIVAMTSLEIKFLEEDESSSTADAFQLSFDLPSGSYATMLLRELMVSTVTRG